VIRHSTGEIQMRLPCFRCRLLRHFFLRMHS
jgi:hypothetical protein